MISTRARRTVVVGVLHHARLLLCLVLSLSLIPALAAAAPDSLEQLLQQVQSEQTISRVTQREREQRFIDERERQKERLAELTAQLQAEEQRTQRLRERFERNETALLEWQAKLAAEQGALGEIHGIARQVAGDFKGVVDNSLVSAEIPGRQPFLDQLARSKAIPGYAELKQLWHMLLEQMVANGRVTAFPASVLSSDGVERPAEVIRVGAFNIVSDGKYLRYLPDSGRLVELPKQPAERFGKLVRAFEAADRGPAELAVDPTRGALLSLLVKSPTLAERIHQGGTIGYVILFVGSGGMLLALLRLAYLGLVGDRIRRQLKSPESHHNNPLGRIMQVYFEQPDVDTETLGLKLDEAVLRELPGLQRGLSTLAILAVITPLLGLLGTVTGIIETFQSITLYGTGDPRMMSGGISQALVTTVLGLVTAVPMLLLHSFLSAKSNSLIQILDERSAAMVARLAERRHAVSD